MASIEGFSADFGVFLTLFTNFTFPNQVLKQMKRTAILIDDDALSREDTRFRLKAIPNLLLVRVFAGVEEAMVYFEIHQEKIDIIFCDIIMPDLDGFDANRLLDGRARLFVFLSRKESFNDEIYSSVTPVFFLRKPIDTNRVRGLLGRLDEVDAVGPNSSDLRDFVFLKENTTKENKRVCLNDVLYINGHGRFIEFVFESGEKLTVDMALSAAVLKLRASQKFVRISNNCVISIHGIDRVDKTLVVYLKDGSMKAVKRTYRTLFLDFMNRNQ